jgi:hypothetical protein
MGILATEMHEETKKEKAKRGRLEEMMAGPRAAKFAELSPEQQKEWERTREAYLKIGEGEEFIAGEFDKFVARLQEQQEGEAEAQRLATEGTTGAVEDVKTATDNVEGAVEKVGKDVYEEELRGKASLLGRATGITDPEKLEEFVNAMMKGEAWTRTRVQEAGVLAQSGEAGFAEYGIPFGFERPAFDDFIYRGDAGGGTITPINRADELLGAKPGGPIAGAMAGMGGPRMVQININGGDTAQIYSVVKKAMRESGVRPAPGGRTVP